MLALSVALLVATSDAGVQERYEAALTAVADQRLALAAEWSKAKRAEKPQVLAKARAVLLQSFDADVMPAWSGTTWDFNGTTERPRDGLIACGYLVSTVLKHLGFQVERYKLAQQASAHIVASVSTEPALRLSNLEHAEVVKRVRETWGEGLYVIGMDYHVGFLRLTATQALLCHAAYVPPAVAVCEDAITSNGMPSTLHVAGPAFTDARLEGWLQGTKVKTVKR